MKNMKRKNKPPKFAAFLLRFLLNHRHPEEMIGDYEEQYQEIIKKQHRLKGWFWFWGQVFFAIPPFVNNSIFWSMIMFKNYLTIAIRVLKKQKVYTTINIIGLAVGLGITIVLTFYVFDDLSYDKFHENYENIYRILSIEDSGSEYAVTSGPLMPAAEAEIPEILQSARISFANEVSINRVDADRSNAKRASMILADPGFLNIFNFKILRGNNADALKVPGSVFLTPEIASALFGEEDPIGKPLDLNVFGNENTSVAAIIEAPPRNSHIQFDIIAAFDPESNPVILDSWDNQFPIGYFLIQEGANIEDIETKITEIARKNDFPKVFTPALQPLSDIHLGSTSIQWDFNVRKNDSIVVNSLGAIGILVLIVACINFINLSTSRAASRAREVGMRKVAGSYRRQVAYQFLCESVIMAIFAFLIALVLINFSSHFLDTLLNKELNLDIRNNISTMVLFLIFSVFIGILSGIYPAIILSSFKPVDVLKGEFKTSGKGVLIRRILVVIQFVITTSLVISIMIIFNQINFLNSMNLGYNKENLLTFRAPVQSFDDVLSKKISAFPGVLSTARISQLPDDNLGRVDIKPEGTKRTEGYQPVRLFVNYDLFDMLDIPIVQGRNFSKDFPADTIDNIIVNEEVVRIAGWNDPIGKRVVFYYDPANILRYKVIGVVKDFHYGSLKNAIEPAIFHLGPFGRNLLVRLQPERTEEAILQIKDAFSELYPDRQFIYNFLDERISRQFNNDRDFAGNVTIFAFIAIFIACLGLTGLVSYTVDQRRKEVAVRKILGCTSTRITSMLAFDFLKWITIANVFAWPCAYYAMNMWLGNFVYKVSFTILPYISGCVVTLAVALATIIFQTIKAGKLNPVECMRN
ncbi:ABC transporter permease [candidate division KSB1 bacterium]